jgi:DNA invertase Pin-like site-specific DNA recombinase
LSEARVEELRQRLAAGESVTALAAEYGISRQTVYNHKAAQTPLSARQRRSPPTPLDTDHIANARRMKAGNR